jgi:hypothetical protein
VEPRYIHPVDDDEETVLIEEEHTEAIDAGAVVNDQDEQGDEDNSINDEGEDIFEPEMDIHGAPDEQ